MADVSPIDQLSYNSAHYAFIGDKDAALTAWTRAVAAKSESTQSICAARDLDPLRSEARYNALLKRWACRSPSNSLSFRPLCETLAAD
jgi:hypothetical protein